MRLSYPVALMEIGAANEVCASVTYKTRAALVPPMLCFAMFLIASLISILLRICLAERGSVTRSGLLTQRAVRKQSDHLEFRTLLRVTDPRSANHTLLRVTDPRSANHIPNANSPLRLRVAAAVFTSHNTIEFASADAQSLCCFGRVPVAGR